MASSICQGLKKSLEPCSTLAGVTQRPCDPNSSHEPAAEENLHVHEKTNKIGSSDGKSNDKNNVEERRWSFIQALSNTIQNSKNGSENEKVYVHPLTKSSSSTLNKKSLEMCTESLGSETGSDGNRRSDDMHFLLSVNHPKERSRIRMSRTYNRDNCFPPPLNSVGSSRGVQVKPYREGGRLILEAVTVTPTGRYLHAERSEGRLTLRFSDDCRLDSKDKDKQVMEEEDEEENDASDVELEEEFHADDETSIGKFRRPSCCRCKGGHENKGLQNWEPFWVAT